MVEDPIVPDLVIFSGAYIGDEMAAEFGQIPPSFLPLGGTRLFEHQFKLARGNTFLSLPDDFDIPPVDQRRLDSLSIQVLRTPAGLSLRDSAKHVLSELNTTKNVEVLFGDTLVFNPCPESADLVSFQNDPAHHFWSYFSPDNPDAPFVAGFGDGITERRILCGHFRFSDKNLLVDCLNSSTDFIQALNCYEMKLPFKKCMVETWFDFGHLSLYHQSKRNYSVARAFNSIVSDGKSVRKSSKQTHKIRAEASWYKALPAELKLHTPKFLGDSDIGGQAGYRMEYLFQPLLSDLYVFGNLPGHVWSQILNSCFEFLKIAHSEKPADGSPETAPSFADDFFQFMFSEKTKTRFANFQISHGIDDKDELNINGNALPPVGKIIDELIANIRPTSSTDISLLHGDFFFGNAFFDFRSTNVSVIDPRAMQAGGAPSIYGDHRYDTAKLAHSIIGNYDHIINGRSILEKQSEIDWQFVPTDIATPAGLDELLFTKAQNTFGIERKELQSMTALLFFSMLPLHSEAPVRQEHLFANALRLSADALEIK